MTLMQHLRHAVICTDAVLDLDVPEIKHSMMIFERIHTGHCTGQIFRLQHPNYGFQFAICVEVLMRIAVAGRAGLVLLDISGGKEARRIPVFNQVDADKPPTDLNYIR